MTATACPPKITTFFQLLDNSPGLDERDKRGKRHSTALVLTGLVLALCCGRDGNLSSLHRHMVNHFDRLQQTISTSQQRVISHAQLPRLLAKVNGLLFARILFEWFGLKLDADQKRWFALDGKELCGNIQPDHKRGEVCVSALSQDNEQILSQLFYNGMKESERPTVRRLLNETGLGHQKLTLDALHLIPSTLKAIQQADGMYVVGLKANQKHLYRYGLCSCLVNKVLYQRREPAQRGHGRIEQRTYCCFQTNPLALASRWKDGGIVSLVRVERIRQKLDGSLLSQEENYFLSNSLPANQSEADELFKAIRHHWRIEVMHHRCDVTLCEDSLRTSCQAISRLI